MPKLYYQGHGSYRISADDGRVIYIDPYAGDGYDVPADLILVTHNHSDHNRIGLVKQKPNCRLISPEDALADGKYNSFDIDGITVEAVEARNIMHNPKRCVGYLLTVDRVKIYCSGDTSKTKQMETFSRQHLDYAILCGDGKFNMSLKEATECARIIGARHNIPVHLKPGALYDRGAAEKWGAPNKLIIEPGQEVTLHSNDTAV
jgi:L-ascorbate metabolism protein UlaG (beta-lactamase superfamily)